MHSPLPGLSARRVRRPCSCPSQTLGPHGTPRFDLCLESCKHNRRLRQVQDAQRHCEEATGEQGSQISQQVQGPAHLRN